MKIRRRIVNFIFYCCGIFGSVAGFVLSAHASPRYGNVELKPTARLGAALFFDKTLSQDLRTSCATCHNPAHAYASTDARAIGTGGAIGTRNAPSLIGIESDDAFFWDGRRTQLRDAVLDPFTNPIELGLKSLDDVIERIGKQPQRMAQFKEVFGNGADVPTPAQISTALEDFVRSLKTGTSTFDRAQNGTNVLPREAEQGRQLFVGLARCSECHTLSASPSRFSDGLYHYSGIGDATKLVELPAIAREVMRSPLDASALGPKVLTNTEWASLGRFVVTLQPKDIGAFRTPSLRNVDRTAPYMHDGSIKTLADAIDHEIYYQAFTEGHSITITTSERLALLKFLQSLSDQE